MDLRRGALPRLTDGRVTLRPCTLDDVDAMVEQCRDPDMQRFTTVPVPYSRDDALAWVESRAAAWESGERCSFAIEAEAGVGPSRFAGSIGLHGITAGGRAEIGFGLHPDARGHGLASAAVRLVIDWAFAELGVRVIRWECVAGNIASWRVAWRNGFRFDGSRRLEGEHRGQLHDVWTASLLATDSREPKTRWLPQPVLSDGLVTLRAAHEGDEARCIEAATDDVAMHWLHEVPLPRDPTAFRERLLRQDLAASLGQSVEWAIADPATDRYLGGLSIFGFGSLDHASAEVGYRTHPDARGRGVTSRALRLLVAHAFTPESGGGLGLQRLSLGAGEGNAGSIGVARSCGFSETGHDRSCYLLADGRVVDLVRYDLLRDEWLARNAPAGELALADDDLATVTHRNAEVR